MMKKVIAIVGPSASGKNTLVKQLKVKYPSYNYVVHSTTRPMRDNEINGVNYNFITEEDMYNKILKGEIVSASNYRGWVYAIDNAVLKEDNLNIGEFNLGDIDELKFEHGVELYVIYITAKAKVRLIRSLQREETPDISEIYRRYFADDEDFYWFEEELKEGKYKYIQLDTSNDIYDFTKIEKFIEDINHENL